MRNLKIGLALLFALGAALAAAGVLPHHHDAGFDGARECPACHLFETGAVLRAPTLLADALVSLPAPGCFHPAAPSSPRLAPCGLRGPPARS